jgi:hypothetical protein
MTAGSDQRAGQHVWHPTLSSIRPGGMSAWQHDRSAEGQLPPGSMRRCPLRAVDLYHLGSRVDLHGQDIGARAVRVADARVEESGRRDGRERAAPAVVQITSANGGADQQLAPYRTPSFSGGRGPRLALSACSAAMSSRARQSVPCSPAGATGPRP